MSKLTKEKLDFLLRSQHVWKRYILGFIIKNKYKDFTFSDVYNYIFKKHGNQYEDLSHEEFDNRVKSTLNQLTKDGSFRKSRDYTIDLKKANLFDVKLEKYKDFWSVEITTLEDFERKQDLLREWSEKDNK